MLRFALFGIPVLVDWWFWLTTAVLGGAFYAKSPDAWARVGTWCLVAFVSIIVHELGHALAGQKFGAGPAIKLHGFGGLTFLHGAQFTRGQSILVSAAGPLAGLGLGLLIVGFSLALPPTTIFFSRVVGMGLYINFFWTFVNLLPIQPLDGGQILRELLGPRRQTVTSMIGFVLAGLLCVWALLERNIFAALLLGMLAYYNFNRQTVEGGVIKD